MSKFNLNIDFGKAPFQSFKLVFEIRNQIAHPKTKSLKNSKLKLKFENNREWNADKWELYANLNEATKILNDTKEIIDTLNKKFPIEKISTFILSEHT